MFTQKYPQSRPKIPDDDYDRRLRYFVSCMNKIYKIKDL